MLQRVIMDVLTRGHAAYRSAGLPIFEDLFGRVYDLPPSEISTICSYFTRQKVALYHGFPRADIDANPSCFLFLQGEQQPNFALADYGGIGGAPVTPASAGIGAGVAQAAAASGASAFILSSLWTHQYQILSLARGSPEPVIWLTELNKSILLAAKTYMLSKAIQSVALAASDVQFREDLAPSDLFARSITLQCGREFSQADTSRSLQEAFKLQGLVAPPGSATHPAGRPIARITPESQRKS